MITGNKGEWSEVYTLLKIISEKQLFAGDSNLNKIETLIFPINLSSIINTKLTAWYLVFQI